MRGRMLEIWVGLFMLVSIIALLILALQVSGLSSTIGRSGYTITAAFDNIGGLKVRSPVTLSGVRIGQVSEITLDPMQFKAVVAMRIDTNQRQLPADTSASILTQGLLGANYISLKPGFDQVIPTTHSDRLFTLAHGQKKLVTLPHSPHGIVDSADFDLYRSTLNTFVSGLTEH